MGPLFRQVWLLVYQIQFYLSRPLHLQPENTKFGNKANSNNIKNKIDSSNVAKQYNKQEMTQKQNKKQHTHKQTNKQTKNKQGIATDGITCTCRSF